MRRGVLIACLTATVLVTQAVAAFAVPGGWVDVDEEDSEVGVGAADEQLTGGSGGSGGPASGCTWTAIPAERVDVLWGVIGSSPGAHAVTGDDITDPLDYSWYWRTCPDGSGGVTSDLIPVPRAGPPVDPTVLRDEAIDRLLLPEPTVAMNPPGDQVVHIESWLWINEAIWTPRARSVSAGGVTTTVRATPRRVIWDMGNGDSVVCHGPGTPYDPIRSADEQTTDCSYTYRHSSADQPGEAYQVTATVEWEVSWTVAGAAGGGALPAMFTTAPTAVRVAEMQALNQ